MLTDDKGRQKEMNLTSQQLIGMRKIKKIIYQGEIVIVESDKGKRLTASSLASYERQGMKHEGSDPVVDWEAANKGQMEVPKGIA